MSLKSLVQVNFRASVNTRCTVVSFTVSKSIACMTDLRKDGENVLEYVLCCKFRFISWISDELLRHFVN